MEVKDRQLGESKERERQCNVRLLECKTQLKDVSEECKRLTGLFAERDSRYNHEVKRMENEMSRLKGKLCKLLGDKVNTTCLNESTHNRNKYSSIPAWIEMTSLICNPDGKTRGRWKTDVKDQRKEEELSQRIIQENQEMQEKVINENAELRESYYNFQYGLVKVLREHDLPIEENITPQENNFVGNDLHELKNTSILLPLDISREQLIDTSDKVIQNLSNVLKRREEKLGSLNGLLNDNKTIIDTSKMADTEDAIKFILKHKEILQEEEQSIHTKKRNLDRRETELKILETEFNIYRENCLINDITLSTPLPLSSISHISTTDHEGPNWSLGKINPTLPPSGKQNISNVPWPGVKIGGFPTDMLHFGQGKRSSVVSKHRSLSHENEIKRGSLSPTRALSPLPLGDPNVKFRRSSNTTNANKPRPRSANLSPSPQRMMLPRRMDVPRNYQQQDRNAKSFLKSKAGISGSLSDSCNSSFDKLMRSGSHSPTSVQR